MENGFSSPRTDFFPAGLRVLVVDDDLAWLKILEKMLKKCSYEVTTCCLAREALDMLRERKYKFDIVISDVNMPDMDGFKLLEHVGLEMDLPVIMMSVDGETSRVMKGVQHGACDYLLKPIRMKELQNIWQHVFRKKIHEVVKDIGNHDRIEDIQMMINGFDEFDDAPVPSTGDLGSAKKRKDKDNKEHDDQETSDTCSVKKARVVWSGDLHRKFVDAVNQIGFDKVGPKKILDEMKVPWLTRENVASHLQKFRLYLSRLQKQNESKTSCCGVPPDFSFGESPGSFSLQCSTTVSQNNAANNNIGFSGTEILDQDAVPSIHEGDLKGIISFLPTQEHKKGLKGDVPNPQNQSNTSQTGITHSFGSLGPDIDSASFEHTIPIQKSWSGQIPCKQKPEPYLLLKDGYNHLQLPDLEHQIPQSINCRISIAERDKSESEIKPFGSVAVVGRTFDVFSPKSDSRISQESSEAISTITSSMKHHSFNQNCTWESVQQSLTSGSGSALVPSDEDLKLSSLQGYGYTENRGFQNMFSNYNDQELITELPVHLYDGFRFNYDYLDDSMEYPIMDQGLFIT